MKALKMTSIIVLIVLLAIGGLFYYGYMNLDGLLKAGIEKYGSRAVGTQVTVESVEVTLEQGRIQINGLEVANPNGYNTDYALAIGTAAVQVNPKSIGQGVIMVDEILVDAASIIAEERNLQQTNLTDLAENLQGDGGKADPAGEADGDSQGPLLTVQQFRFSNANISLVSDRYGDRTLNMPTVAATNLGSPDGLPPQALANQLLERVIDQARNTVKEATRDAAKKKVRSEAKEKLDEELSDEDKEKLDEARSLLDR